VEKVTKKTIREFLPLFGPGNCFPPFAVQDCVHNCNPACSFVRTCSLASDIKGGTSTWRFSRTGWL